MMIIVQNIFTLCKFITFGVFSITSEASGGKPLPHGERSLECVGCIGNNKLFFEDVHDDSDDDEEFCYCNLCSTTRNVILFTTRRLKYEKV